MLEKSEFWDGEVTRQMRGICDKTTDIFSLHFYVRQVDERSPYTLIWDLGIVGANGGFGCHLTP